MNFALNNIAKDPTHVVLEADASKLPEVFATGAHDLVSAQIDVLPLAGDTVLVQGKVKGKIRVDCGRCLDPLEKSFGIGFNLLIEKCEDTGLQWSDDEEGGVEDYHAKTGPDVVEIPLDHIIAEQVLLNYNLHPLPELDDLQRCVQCGLSAQAVVEPKKGDRVDPRWVKLKSLREGLSDSKD